MTENRQIKNRVGRSVFEDGDGRLMKFDYSTGLYYRLPDFRKPNKSFMERMRTSLNQANLEIQGSVVKLSFNRIAQKQQGGGVRKQIIEFSAKSRKAMIERMARIDYSGRVTFITLTYKTDVSHSEAKSHLRAFLKRLRRKHPKNNFAAVWRMEYQERGTIHWHIMCFGLPFTAWAKIREDWRKITGQGEIVNVRIELIRDTKKARRYVAKYIAKKTEASPGSPLFTDVTNQAALGLPGRFWGIEGRQFLPMAQLIVTTITDLEDIAHEFKDYMRVQWSGVNETKYHGAMIFTDNAYDWLMLWRWLLTQGD